MATEANEQLQAALELIEGELEEYRSMAVATENRYAVIGGLIGGTIGLVGGLVGALATAALGAIIAKDMGGSWGDVLRDCAYPVIDPNSLELSDEQRETMLSNRRRLKSFETHLTSARLTSTDYYRVKGIWKSLTWTTL